MADVDSSQVIVDLLENNWNDANTDSLTPTFTKIFEQPKNEIDFDKSRDYVLVFNPTTDGDEIGIGGTATENVFETMTIDVRSFGEYSDTGGLTDDSHVRKVRTEIDRILKTNKTGANISPFNTLSSIQQWQELNDRYRGIFRYVKTAELTQYCRDFS